MSDNEFPSYNELQELTDREILCMIVEKLRDLSQKQSDHVKAHTTYTVALLSISAVVVGEMLLILLTL